MAETEKTPKKVNDTVGAKEPSPKEDKNCYILDKIITRTKKRLDSLEDAINEEINPLHRIELEAKRSENANLLCFLKGLAAEGPISKILEHLFGE